MASLFHHVVCLRTVRNRSLNFPFIYSCVPKAATCSIYGAIAQHLGIPVVNNNAPDLSPEWDLYEVDESIERYKQGKFHFSFVRNTYARIASYWAMRWERNDTKLDFSTWLYQALKYQVEVQDFHMTSQLRTLDPSPNFIGRFENLKHDWRVVQKETGLPDLPHYNRSVTSCMDYRELYNKSTKKMVSEYYRDEIDRFGFTF